MGRRPPSEPGVMHLTTAAAVRMRAGRTDTRSAPEQPEAARHRPKTSDCRYPISSRLVSSRLISSRQLPHDVTTIRPKSAAVISSFVPTTQECYRHRLLASIPGSRPILVSSVSPHLIVSSLFSALSSHLVQSPGFPTGQQCGPLHSREQRAPPPYRSTEQSKGSTTALPAAAAELLHGGGDPLRPRAEAWCPARAEATPRADTGCAPRSRAPHGELRRGLAACLCRLARRCAAYSATSRQAASYAGLAACLSRPERRHAAQESAASLHLASYKAGRPCGLPVPPLSGGALRTAQSRVTLRAILRPETACLSRL